MKTTATKRKEALLCGILILLLQIPISAQAIQFRHNEEGPRAWEGNDPKPAKCTMIFKEITSTNPYKEYSADGLNSKSLKDPRCNSNPFPLERCAYNLFRLRNNQQLKPLPSCSCTLSADLHTGTCNVETGN